MHSGFFYTCVLILSHIYNGLFFSKFPHVTRYIDTSQSFISSRVRLSQQPAELVIQRRQYLHLQILSVLVCVFTVP